MGVRTLAPFCTSLLGCLCLAWLPGPIRPTNPTQPTPTQPPCAGATPDMRVFREEVFGPVTPVFKFSTDEGE